jgi:hypothetical protein
MNRVQSTVFEKATALGASKRAEYEAMMIALTPAMLLRRRAAGDCSIGMSFPMPEMTDTLETHFRACDGDAMDAPIWLRARGASVSYDNLQPTDHANLGSASRLCRHGGPAYRPRRSFIAGEPAEQPARWVRRHDVLSGDRRLAFGPKMIDENAADHSSETYVEQGRCTPGSSSYSET